jgi:Flp pilus assembly protein TadG
MRSGRKCTLPPPQGQAIIEFSLTMLSITMLFFAIWEAGMTIHTYNTLADAAKEGVRYAVVHGSDVDPKTGNPSGPTCANLPCTNDCSTNVQAVQGVVQSVALLSFGPSSKGSLNGMTVSVCYLDGSNKPPNRVQVAVSYPYQPFFSTLGFPSPTINAGAEGRIVF